MFIKETKPYQYREVVPDIRYSNFSLIPDKDLADENI